jgi:hypothetical protein
MKPDARELQSAVGSSLMKQPPRYLAIAIAAVGFASFAQAEVPDAEQLAQRFRPYYKFTVDKGREAYRPCSWQWFLAHADLYRGKTRLASSTDLSGDYTKLLRYADADIRTTRRPFGDVLELRTIAGSAGGEPWEKVINDGAGLYVQCEDAGDGFVVLTYWTLFAYNKTTFRIRLFGKNFFDGDHEGDIIAVTVVYDHKRDQLVRASYGIHGEVLDSFDLVPSTAEHNVSLPGRDPENHQVSVSAKLIRPHRDYQNGRGLRRRSSPEIYLVGDPASGRWEHLAVFCEWGAHEPWPNPTGDFISAPKHTGNDVSFLPKRVRYIGSFSNPAPEERPFVYFNGKWGNDPEGIIFHRSCFYPEGRKQNRFRIPESSFVDRDPFGEGTLHWPPAKGY